MLLLLLLLVSILYLFIKAKRPSKFPPGPVRLPLFGSSILLQKLLWKNKNTGSAIQQLESVYKSPLVGLNLGSETIVVAYGQTAIDLMLKRSCEGRPDNFFVRQRTMGVRKGVTGVDGQLWQVHRQFIVRSLKNFGYGKSKMEIQILETVRELIDTFKELRTNVSLSKHISKSIINILWIFVAGKILDKNQAQINNILLLLEKRSKVFDLFGGLLNHFPWIRFIAPEKSGYSLIKSVNKEMHTFLSDVINTRKNEKFDEEDDLDIIGAYLNKIKSAEEESTFDEEQLMMVCLDLLVAGSHTTSSFMSTAFYALLVRPEIQKKLHFEIDSVIGKRELTFSDYKLLPYTVATINEIQRYYSIFPLNGPRRTLEEVNIGKYVIPKDTTVFFSIQSIHMDQAIWKDPEIFRPERFLGEDNILVNTQNNYTFGAGRRRCLADTFAKHCVFMIFASVLQQFYIKETDSNVLTNTFENGIFIQPKAYTVNLEMK